METVRWGRGSPHAETCVLFFSLVLFFLLLSGFEVMVKHGLLVVVVTATLLARVKIPPPSILPGSLGEEGDGLTALGALRVELQQAACKPLPALMLVSLSLIKLDLSQLVHLAWG